MITISFKSNIQQVVDKFAREVPKAVVQAELSALNKTAAGAKTRMARVIVANYRLKSSFVKERLRIAKARRKGQYELTAILSGNEAGGNRRSMNLIHFAVNKLTGKEKRAWKKQSGMRNPQLPFQIKKTGGRVYIKGAFVGNNGRTVFERIPGTTMESRGKYAGTTHAEALKPVQTIGVPQMFNATKSIAPVQRWIAENFSRIFASEYRYYMAKADYKATMK